MIVFISSAVVAAAVIFYRLFVSRRGKEPGFEFVYVNQDGTVRELSPREKEYLSEKFSGGDGGRPYIKSSYESADGWGSRSGFIERRRVPASAAIAPVNPDYDALEAKLGQDLLGANRAAGDIIETNADGSITCKPNPNISREERFERSRRHQLAEQRRRESLAKP
jgi:hypothetical protein